MLKVLKEQAIGCLKNPKCVAYNWNHNTKKITMLREF